MLFVNITNQIQSQWCLAQVLKNLLRHKTMLSFGSSHWNGPLDWFQNGPGIPSKQIRKPECCYAWFENISRAIYQKGFHYRYVGWRYFFTVREVPFSQKLISLSDKHCKTENRCLERQNRRKCVAVVQFCIVTIVVLVFSFRAWKLSYNICQARPGEADQSTDC